jgi:hypothetical protein
MVKLKVSSPGPDLGCAHLGGDVFHAEIRDNEAAAVRPTLAGRRGRLPRVITFAQPGGQNVDNFH